MAMVEWDKSLECGCEQIDEQHRAIFDIINDIHERMGQDRAEDVLREALRGLNDYTATHFTLEEGLMRQFNVPGLEAHLAEHEKFKEYIDQLSSQGPSDAKDKLYQMMLYLMKWIVRHIRKVDMRYKGLITPR